MGYEDATLSAEYTVNTYQVKYDGNGATGTMPNSTYTYGVSYNLISNTYQKTGYTFVGWNTDKTKTEALGICSINRIIMYDSTDSDENFGVRPAIEVSKDNISY